MFRLLVLTAAAAFAQPPGRPATDAEIKSMDFTVLPNGTGLPKGHGDAVRGRAIYDQQCEECHVALTVKVSAASIPHWLAESAR